MKGTSPSSSTSPGTVAPSASEKIKAWQAKLRPGDQLKVIFGGHWSNNPGWLVLDENDQDIGQRLGFQDNSVDVIYTEHVFEHVDFSSAVSFLKESKRILKPGGVFRVVCPMLDSILSADLTTPDGKIYIQNSLTAHFSQENEILRDDLGLGGIDPSAAYEFYINSMFREWGHRFIWSSDLLMRVMRAIGYREFSKKSIGEGVSIDYCLERRRRGIYLGNDWREEMDVTNIFDPESTIVEAKK